MSEGFSPGWLDLREPFDTAARNAALLERLAAWRRDRGPLHVVDLGAGTGANLRRTAPVLDGPQHWTLVERDRGLIRAGEARLAGEATEWRYRRLDLATELEALGDEPCDLLTASALLDLVSAEWLEKLAGLCRRTGAALYVALSYDGRIEWEPSDPLDAEAAALVNAHQRSDKGFGAALGPAAATLLAKLLGSQAETGDSAWSLGRDDIELQAALLHGYTRAAMEMAPPSQRPVIVRWSERRGELLRRGGSRLLVGHVDLLMLP